MFPLGVFSIHNFNLRNLKGNGNAATVVSLYIAFLTSFLIIVKL